MMVCRRPQRRSPGRNVVGGQYLAAIGVLAVAVVAAVQGASANRRGARTGDGGHKR